MLLVDKLTLFDLGIFTFLIFSKLEICRSDFSVIPSDFENKSKFSKYSNREIEYPFESPIIPKSVIS